MDKNTFILMYNSKGQEWGTPLELYHKLNNEFHFTTDPCTTPDNRLGCRVFYTKVENGLHKKWEGNVFCNPPYGKEVKKWIAKCANHASQGLGTVVMLIPARTDTRWYHDFICSCFGDGNSKYTKWKFCYGTRQGVTKYLLQGRLKFENPEHKLNSAPFPSMIVVFRPPKKNKFF